MKTEINKYKEASNQQRVPLQALHAADPQAPQAPQAVQVLPQAQGHTQEDHQVSHQVVPQVDPRTIWRPPGHPPVVVDECVHNVRCEGNCDHVIGHNNTTHKPEELKVTCHHCKQKFKDKVSMMDHKRDSDHPSKKKCNKFPDCEREGSCWYVHERPMGPQTNT